MDALSCKPMITAAPAEPDGPGTSSIILMQEPTFLLEERRIGRK
jgi:hypothetical protein